MGRWALGLVVLMHKVWEHGMGDSMVVGGRRQDTRS